MCNLDSAISTFIYWNIKSMHVSIMSIVGIMTSPSSSEYMPSDSIL